MDTLANRGGWRGGYRGRGRGRGGNFGGWNQSEHEGGFGRGRGGGGQGDRGGHEGGQGRGRGQITDEQKAQISTAARPTTIQIASDGTDDIIIASSASDDIRHLATMALNKKEFAFRGQWQICRFVNSCLLNLSNHHTVDTSGLLLAFASDSGSVRLKEILMMPMGTDEALSSSRLSFQLVILPLVGVLTRESICQSTVGNESNKIYAIVYAYRRKFIEEGVISCMQQVLSRGSLTEYSPGSARIQREDQNLCVVTSMSCALLAVVRLVYQLITRIHDARATLATIVMTLVAQARMCAQISNGTDRDQFINRILVREVNRLQRIVSDTQDAIIPFFDETVADLNVRSANGPNMVHLRNTYDPPGMISAKGPRHDNDFVDISEISLLPTQQEITCSREPFLPSNGILDAPHFLAHGWKRQVDTHFRLYREDMMQPLRESIMAFLSTLQRTPVGKEDHLLKPKELRKALGDKASLNVYGDVQLMGLNMDKKSTCSIKIQFAQPQQVLGMTRKSQRAEFWERSKNRLMQGGLVCLVSRATGHPSGDNDAFSSSFQLVLAVVGWRDPDALSVNDKVARIRITLADSQQYLLLLNSASQNLSNQWFLVESPGAYFGAYRPILLALQQCIPASLPFGKYLAPTVEEQAEISIVKDFVDPPIYARAPTFQYDLSVLLKGRSCQLDVNSAASVQQAIDALQRNSTLDDTQATALVDTLCREVALINGPPGTGKTWIGIALMEVLLANKAQSDCGPILCICYTNHALDQFLEHLLDKGIPKVVRVGARSKSERLEKYNLQTLMGSVGKPYHVRSALREIKAELESNAEEMRDLEEALRGDCAKWENMQTYLQQDYHDLYAQFIKSSGDPSHTFNLAGDEDLEENDEDLEEIDDDESGEFTRVEDKKFRNLHLFDRWRLGQDIQEKTRWNTSAKENLETLSKKTSGRRSKKNSKKKQYAALVDRENVENLKPPVYQTIPSTNRPVPLLLDSDIWGMSMTERQRLLDHWRPEMQETLMTRLSTAVKNVQTLNEAKNSAFDEIRRGILRECSVVGMTTNGAAKSQELIKKLAPKIIICEEAGEVLESHILSALSSSTQHLILIGDHKQLRPQIETYNLSSDSPKGKSYNLDKSLFERLVTSAKNPLPMSVLTTQRRMRPCISNLIRGPLYPDLVDGGSVREYPPVCGMGKDLFFMNHAHPEDAKDTYGMQSFSNRFEVQMAKALAIYLIKNGYNQPGDIAILTPYLGQLSKLRDALKDIVMVVLGERDQEQLDQMALEEGTNEGQETMHAPGGAAIGVKKLSLQTHITLRTIDNYQGEEAKIIIISLVRNDATNDSSTSGRIGFLKSPNRTNVLLSRAQHGMFIIGNAAQMENEKNGIWPSVIEELRAHDRIGNGFPLMCKNHPETFRTVESAEQLIAVAPNGGCDLACGHGMACGHVCPLQCHPDDIEHHLVKCLQPCNHLHSICQHACPKTCSDPCGNCMVIMGPMALSCGHILDEPKCHQKKSPSTIVCRVVVTRTLPSCGHEKDMECHEDPSEDLCRVKVTRNLHTCEHIKEMKCHEDPAKVSCAKLCASSLPCGHNCTKTCDVCQSASLIKTDESAKPAEQIPRTVHGTCSFKCNEKLSCGHTCGVLCHKGSNCPPCKKPCESACAHKSCSFPCDSPCFTCSEPCVWRCEHHGQCSMPCGMPCDRLPCNERCEKLLTCGHRCPSICGEICPPPKFCVECKDPATMRRIMPSGLGHIDVDTDPILVLSCDHALTMTTLDVMMEMGNYYEQQVNPMTGNILHIAKLPLPGNEVKQVSCPSCQKPIAHLLRYGRRIKYTQISKSLKTYQITQENALVDARERFDNVKTEVQKSRRMFLLTLQGFAASSKAAPPSSKSRKLVKFLREPDLFPFANFSTISAMYGIPPKHRAAWAKHMQPVLAEIKTLNQIIKGASKSPTKDAFKAAYAHFYQLNVTNKAPLSDVEGRFSDGIYVDEIDSDEVSAMTQECVVESELPADGYGGSPYVEFLAEKTKALLLVLLEASIALELVGPMSGWYWFVEDLRTFCLVYTEILMEAAMNGRYYRRLALSRVILLDILRDQVRWLNLRPVSGGKDAKDAKDARFQLAHDLSLSFAEEMEGLQESCPTSIKERCLAKAKKIEEKFITEVKMAKGELPLGQPSSTFETIQVVRVISSKIDGPSYWYRCSNGHTYVKCGMTMLQSSCSECRDTDGEVVRGRSDDD